PWLQLSEVERQKVIDILLPYVFRPTLIHELGHNLGLRHNFAGSEDKDNFYTEAELKEMGVTRPFAYSSVMDYPYRTNNELRVMGKYDVAALRYAYAEQVETADGRMIPLSELHAQPATEIKAYGYCTDEHVSANPNCNRFDEGTNILEIAQHYVQSYEHRYKRANFRNGRRKFSQFQDSAQIGAIDGMMLSMRLMFERYESIKNTFDLADDAAEWKSIPFLADLRNATLVAGNFFINVVKTPDLMCAVSEAANPTQIIALLPIRQLSKRAVSCFDQEEVRLNPKYMIVAEAGKSFQSRKDPKSDNPYADQIDVRGIYIDKLLATHYLFARELGSSLFDQYTENFLHMPELQGPVLDMMSQILLDEMAGPVEFRTIFGPTVELEVNYSLFDVVDANNSHKLPAVMDPVARAIFGLPDKTQLFPQIFIGQMKKQIPSAGHSGLSNAVLNLVQVHPFLPQDGRQNEYQPIELQGQRLFVHPSSVMANQIALSYNVTSLLQSLTEEQMAKVLKAIADKSDEGLTPIELAAKSIGQENIQRFQQGGFHPAAYYAFMLRSLAGLN
ncbi:MAG: zinc-dependent metalloprotease, partial [Bdellovibrionales bacterium]